jgi:hypothetical protein
MASPTIYKGQRGLALSHRTEAKRRVGAPREMALQELRPYERSRCAEHEEEVVTGLGSVVCPPHRG